MPPTTLAAFTAFRTQLYATFGARQDALFELTDALLTTGPVLALPHLSLAPLHRRGWGSLYTALRAGEIDSSALQTLIRAQPLPDTPPIYAVDCSIWPRCEAETSANRGYYYHPSRHSGGVPVVKGWAYQWIAQLGLTRDSWTAPVDVQRLLPTENATAVALTQIWALLPHLPPAATSPLFVFDAGYDASALGHAFAGEAVGLLIRVRSDRCFYAVPDPATQPREGRRRRDGTKFDCADPATWPAPTHTYTSNDARYGAVQVQAWTTLHTVMRTPAGQGQYRPRIHVTGTVLRVAVHRIPGQTREPQVLWLWWQGPDPLDLDLLWRAYVRRFDLEQTFRFFKQTLNWVVPHLRTPEQADRWTWLVVAAYTQLRLARTLVADARLPWQQALPVTSFTPGRVQRGCLTLLRQVGTPAAAPNPCGRSPGRPKGRHSLPAPRYPPLKKSA